MRIANVAFLLLLAPLFPARRAFSFASGAGSAQSRTQHPAKVAVKTAYEAYLRAWKDKDYAALNELLSDDCQALNFQGVISTKANEIATAKNDRTYDTMTGDVRSIAIFGGRLEGRIGTRQKSTFRFLAILQNQKDDWKLVATQSTKFNKPAEPGKRSRIFLFQTVS